MPLDRMNFTVATCMNYTVAVNNFTMQAGRMQLQLIFSLSAATTLDFSDLPTALLATATMVPRPTSTPTPMIELQPYAVAIITVAILVVICFGCLMCTCIALCFRKKCKRRTSQSVHKCLLFDAVCYYTIHVVIKVIIVMNCAMWYTGATFRTKFIA